MKKITTILIIVLAIVAVGTQVVSIYISNNSATDSITASELSQKLELLQEENTNFESEILSYASYQVVASRAATLGYENTKDFISVYEPVQVAKVQ